MCVWGGGGSLDTVGICAAYLMPVCRRVIIGKLLGYVRTVLYVDKEEHNKSQLREPGMQSQ